MGASAATHGGKEGDFIAGMQWRIPGSELLITRGDYRGTVFRELGKALGK